MKQLTDEQRKRLTLYIGKKWIEPDVIVTCFDSYNCNATFTTYSDLGALKDKLVENGEWAEFHVFAYNQFKGVVSPSCKDNPPTFNGWLFRPESCGLVAEYLEQKEGK